MISKYTAVLAGLALCAGMAVAQDATAPAPVQRHHAMHGHFMGGGPEMGMFLHQLNLTDDQKAQIKQIFKSEKTNMKPLMQSEFTAHDQMLHLIANDKFDQAAVTKLAAQESQVHMQLEVEHAKIASQVYQLLSSEQKSKVADLITQHEQRMQQHMQNQQQAAPPSE
jgi:protein CpxP